MVVHGIQANHDRSVMWTVDSWLVGSVHQKGWLALSQMHNARQGLYTYDLGGPSGLGIFLSLSLLRG